MGHDYIKMLSETVNLANGSLSIRIQAPMPKGRGAFFGTMYPAFWQFGPTKAFRGAYTLLEFG